MQEYEYEGKVYLKTEHGWFSKNGERVPKALAQKLAQALKRTEPEIDKISLDGYTIAELIEEGDRYKQMEYYRHAIAFYEKAFQSPDIEHKKYVIPRLTSCYRHADYPKKAIELFSFVERIYPKFVDHVLLTSIAAAYCDVKDYDAASHCCERAQALLSPWVENEPLRLVMLRITSEDNRQ